MEIELDPETARKLQELYEEGRFVSVEQMLYNILPLAIDDEEWLEELHNWMLSIYEERIEKPEKEREGRVGESPTNYGDGVHLPKSIHPLLASAPTGTSSISHTIERGIEALEIDQEVADKHFAVNTPWTHKPTELVEVNEAFWGELESHVSAVVARKNAE